MLLPEDVLLPVDVLFPFVAVFGVVAELPEDEPYEFCEPPDGWLATLVVLVLLVLFVVLVLLVPLESLESLVPLLPLESLESFVPLLPGVVGSGAVTCCSITHTPEQQSSSELQEALMAAQQGSVAGHGSEVEGCV